MTVSQGTSKNQKFQACENESSDNSNTDGLNDEIIPSKMVYEQQNQSVINDIPRQINHYIGQEGLAPYTVMTKHPFFAKPEIKQHAEYVNGCHSEFRRQTECRDARKKQVASRIHQNSGCGIPSKLNISSSHPLHSRYFSRRDEASNDNSSTRRYPRPYQDYYRNNPRSPPPASFSASVRCHTKPGGARNDDRQKSRKLHADLHPSAVLQNLDCSNAFLLYATAPANAYGLKRKNAPERLLK